MKRVGLEDGTQIKKHSLDLMKMYFKGCKRAGAFPSEFCKASLGNMVEVYEIGDRFNVGVIYPDGARQIWIREWWDKRKDRILDHKLTHTPYNMILNRSYKRVELKKEVSVKRVKMKPKAKRVELKKEVSVKRVKMKPKAKRVALL